MPAEISEEAEPGTGVEFLGIRVQSLGFEIFGGDPWSLGLGVWHDFLFPKELAEEGARCRFLRPAPRGGLAAHLPRPGLNTAIWY